MTGCQALQTEDNMRKSMIEKLIKTGWLAINDLIFFFKIDRIYVSRYTKNSVEKKNIEWDKIKTNDIKLLSESVNDDKAIEPIIHLI